MSGAKRGWYVLRAISGKEAKVKEILDAAIKNTPIGNYVFQVLIPTEKVFTTKKDGKKVLKDRMVYSGYVFVEAELTGEVEYELRNTTNVIDFLRGRAKGSKPETLREADVMRMLGRMDDTQVVDENADAFVIGEPVKITFGPFVGMVGEIKEVNTEKQKLKVEVKIFGRPTDVELEISQVEKTA